jgi:hypothetical protein
LANLERYLTSKDKEINSGVGHFFNVSASTFVISTLQHWILANLERYLGYSDMEISSILGIFSNR